MDYPSEFDDCLANVIDSLKKILYVRHNDIFDRVDFYDDSIFQEPLIYTYIGQKDDKWFDSILYGYEKNRKNSIAVFSNSRGVIYLPRIGYFNTSLPSATLVLKTNGETLSLELNGEDVPYSFDPILFVSYGFEVVRDQHPLLESVFVTQGTAEEVIIENIYKKHIDALNEGLDSLRLANPVHFSLLQKNLKKIMLFNSQAQNSFSVLAAHNMIFLNVNDWDDQVFFVDHISHEGAHTTFFTLTYETKTELFNCHHNDPVGNFIGEPGQHSAIYLYFHGLFTFLEIINSLSGCFNSERFSDQQHHDIRGRFIFHMQRYKLSIDMFEEMDNIFQPLGRQWMDFFKAHYYRFEAKFNELFPQYTMLNQQYDFSSKTFKEVNSFILTEKPTAF